MHFRFILSFHSATIAKVAIQTNQKISATKSIFVSQKKVITFKPYSKSSFLSQKRLARAIAFWPFPLLAPLKISTLNFF